LAGSDGEVVPPELPDIYGSRPRTVIFGFDRTLVEMVWRWDEGWRIAKRPGVHRLAATAFEHGFESVVWHDGSINDFEPIMVDFDTESTAHAHALAHSHCAARYRH
jgi:hypothetical protein